VKTVEEQVPGKIMDQPLISIVVPTYNRCEMLRGALESFLRQRTGGVFSYEVIVVDNGSTDDTKRVFDELAAANYNVNLRYVYEATPTHPDALNRGVTESKGRWIAFFDDDQFAPADWLWHLFHAAMETGSKIVGGPISLDLSEEELALLGPVCRKVLREYKPYVSMQRYDGVNLPGSGNMMVAREVFDKIGYFDNSIVTGACDRDFGARARLTGYDIWYNPRATGRHRISRNRLSPAYLRWEQLKGGTQTASYDYKFSGCTKMLVYCFARITKSLVVHLPVAICAWLMNDQRILLDQKCTIWRMEGYARQTLFLISPRMFAQRAFFSSMQIRKGRADGINL
jgi:glycosyltransferase involved in cell wall biosynthesis